VGKSVSEEGVGWMAGVAKRWIGYRRRTFRDAMRVPQLSRP